MKPPEPETTEEIGQEVCKTPEPKPWVSLGSELEIEAESVKESRPKVQQYILKSHLISMLNKAVLILLT